jgi:hypothetical protein
MEHIKDYVQLISMNLFNSPNPERWHQASSLNHVTVEVFPANCEGSPTNIDNDLLICAYPGSPMGGLLLPRVAETLLS